MARFTRENTNGFTEEELSTILAEEEKDTGWLMYVVVAVVAIGILFFTMG